MTEDQWLLYHLQIRNPWVQEELNSMFESQSEISDVEFLEKLHDATTLWVSDQDVLDILEDQMTFQDAMFLFNTAVEHPTITEYELFNALGIAFERKLAGDLAYVRGQFEVESGQNVDPE
jgi:hypothetical protein